MESMDYNYFAAAPQPYQYMGYGDFPQASGDAMGATPVSNAESRILPCRALTIRLQSMENLDSTTFNLNSFDYNFDASLGQGTGLTPMPATSASPPAQQLSMLPNGSVDSGIAMDMENEPSGRRGSSEEKDSLTPAQSRRKAQNRAA